MKLFALCVALTLLLVGCGTGSTGTSTEDGSEAAPTEAAAAASEATEAATSAPTEAATEVAGSEFCDALIEVQQVEPSSPDAQATLEEFAQKSPAELQEAIATLGATLAKGEQAAFDPAFYESKAAIYGVATEECADGTADVTGSDYAFAGVSGELGAGQTVFTFDNAGKELHEMIVFRKKPNVTESVSEILELPEAEVEKKVDFVGAAFAAPGNTDGTMLDLTAGEYAMLCFIPVGLTEKVAKSGKEPKGPPHFTRGMVAEFSVS